MSTLHTVNKSLYDKNSLDECLGHATAGSAVFFYEDGVYAALTGGRAEARLKSLSDVKVYVLGPDVAARGFTEARVADGIEVVGYDGFVDLVASYDKVIAWV